MIDTPGTIALTSSCTPVYTVIPREDVFVMKRTLGIHPTPMATTGRRVHSFSTRLTSMLHDCPHPICLKWIPSFSIEAPTFLP
jgi:hypothetical protein